MEERRMSGAKGKKKTVKKKDEQKPLYKKWWFWVIVFFVFAGIISAGQSTAPELPTDESSEQAEAEDSEKTEKDYTGQDAKVAYQELIGQGYAVKFVFDRNNNGGFSEADFQDFVLNDSFASEAYSEMPFVVTKQEISNKDAVLYIDYGEVVASDQAQKAREEQLEERLGIVESMTACELYGQRNYRDFKMHDIVGKIAEYASDDNTWFLKYYVDADGYKNKTMECYVTGTSASPQVTKFLVY